ncbi:MAG: ParB N-terminal domain-containing protein, partial [Planctomycetota bacterium]
MKPIDIKGIPLEKHIFHNEPLDVYPTRTSFSKIAFWPENYRTVLHFDILEAEKNRPVSKLSLEEITEFLVGRPELRLGDLASSIKKNGVKVPLIILTNGMLLDGNRRYFACSHLFHEAKKEGNDIPEVLYDIPVYVIKKGDVDERTRQKILAEANFVNDWKVPW